MSNNTYGGETLPALPFKRRWAKCPHCGKNIVLFHDSAKCTGVFFKCRQCHKEFELKIILGVQEK